MSMNTQRSGSHTITLIALLVCIVSAFLMTGCSSDKAKAKALVAEYMTGQGTTDIVIDIFHKSRNSPDKAYVGATVTYNFASSNGKPQREFLGFVLSQSNDGWRIERNTFYTKEEDKAEQYIAGNK